MMTSFFHIEDTNISRGWARVFLEMMEPGVKEFAPLVVSLSGFSEEVSPEILSISSILDETLFQNGKQSCKTVANTIFPKSLWNPNRNRDLLYARYRKILPDLHRYKGNGYGLYFERLIAFESFNQLEHIIQTRLRGNRRRSALQAIIFNPKCDHTHQRRRGFPCLQHILFAPQKNNGLSITGVYATQYIFERAYGNYLGLYNLGQFVAHELSLNLTQVHCITNRAVLGDVKKKELVNLANELRNILEDTSQKGDRG
jgi:hypothetical protein